MSKLMIVLLTLTLTLTATLTLALAVSACGTSTDEPVLVMAAASLTDAFTEMVDAFEEANPAVDVQLNLAGSPSLRAQILAGAPADVFASANAQTMQAVVDAGEARGAPQSFATNTLQIAVPSANEAGVESVEDLANADLLVGLCATGVPCGDHARTALGLVGIEPSIDTNESDVRALLIKLEADELDAGIVYATDVQSSNKVVGIELPPQAQVTITYPIVALQEAPNSDGAAVFVAFVLSAQGQQILAQHGFGTP